MCAMRVTQVSRCIDLVRLQLLEQGLDEAYVCIAQVLLRYCTCKSLEMV